MNEMAKTSVREGLALEDAIMRDLNSKGWEVARNTRVLCTGPDGTGIKPDLIGKCAGGKPVVIEVKSNGPKKGTLHEKWTTGAIKIAHAGKLLKRRPVMIIRDQSGKLSPFIQAYVAPVAKQYGVLLMEI